MNDDLLHQAQSLLWAADQEPDPTQSDQWRRQGEFLMARAKEEA